ncbi:MAG: adenylyl-sulfate kinase [Candidatus Marinimicrobia bacterium]|nr:adenylyl-sulfate kinase [Candidatus Neomarinimicrobiota bacterium]
MNENIIWHNTEITRRDREEQQGHQGVVLWLTGLSGSGKSTVATALQKKLFETGHRVYILDGDNIRHGLNADLGFSEQDRMENIRRIGEVAKLFMDAGVITITAFISPFRTDRNRIRDILPEGKFIEVHVSAPLEVCESRDPKGLYKKARTGELFQFTGIDSPYEEPEKPEIVIETFRVSVEENVAQIYYYLVKHHYIKTE